ncbi:hypothetical protein T4D_4630 [Trichinella pseudospiralis]|uniref:Uncharacterized protein n=1 Tax=Trichinella pseudospiralis TaxID=6337 RepID=A0A0V1FTQ0_TRIPS|nr:hypothetical protein T4D_4630 [Trichinella pseudospiralis]
MHNKSVNQCPQLTDDRWQKQKQQRQKKKKKKKKKKRGTNAGRKMQADMSYNNRASTLSNVEQTARLTRGRKTTESGNIDPGKLKPLAAEISGEKSGQPIAPTCPTSNAVNGRTSRPPV